MKINYLAYLDPFVYDGGGELASRTLIEAGRSLGHDIRVSARRWGRLSKYVGPRYHVHAHPDLWLLANVWNCPDAERPLDFGLIERIVEREPYAHIEDAYVDICEKPFLPCAGDASKCGDACTLERARWLYSNSRVSVFVSPLQARLAIGLLGPRVVRSHFCLRPCVDTARFYNMHIARDIPYLYVGTIADYKGYRNIKERFGHEGNFVFVGPNVTGERLFGVHVGKLPPRQLPLFYNRAQNFVHLPEWVEPQGRTVVEASLCGCTVIANDNVGAMSFEFDLGDPTIIADAPHYFWRELTKRM